MSACSGADEWQRALELLEKAFQEAEVNLIVLNAGISACERGSDAWLLGLSRRNMSFEDWPRALELMRHGIQTDIVSYNAAISACGKGLSWQWAFHLLGAVQEERLRPTTDQLQRCH